MRVIDLGQLNYRDAWALQEQAHAKVIEGDEEQLFLVEHTPVITLGRRGQTDGTLLSSAAQLQAAGIDLIHSDRGGDITYHGPGQIVAYPIIRLADHGFSVSGYMHTLESIVIATLAELNIEAFTDPKAVGVWTMDANIPAKICALGVRVRRGVTLHGLALNVSGDLSGFKHIVPCGLAGRPVTSIARILGKSAPDLTAVKQILQHNLLHHFSTAVAR